MNDDEKPIKQPVANTPLQKKILITGITDSGTQFRPSDWAERMSGCLSTFDKHRIRYSPLLQPTMRDGHKCIILDPALKNSNPKLYESILEFAENNHLVVCDDDK